MEPRLDLDQGASNLSDARIGELTPPLGPFRGWELRPASAGPTAWPRTEAAPRGPRGAPRVAGSRARSQRARSPLASRPRAIRFGCPAAGWRRCRVDERRSGRAL